MQRKLKSVFRRSSKSRSSSGQHDSPENNTYHAESSPPRGDRRRISSDRHGRTSVDSSVVGSTYTGRSRPVSSVYDDRRQSQASTKHPAATDIASSPDPNGGAIATDYKAYLPALSPVNDEHGDEYIIVNGDRPHTTRGDGARHEENVADRNISRYSTSIDGRNRNVEGVASNGKTGTGSGVSASNQTLGQEHVRRKSVGVGSVERHPVGQAVTTDNGPIAGIRQHTETAHVKPRRHREEPHFSDGDHDASRSPHGTYEVQGSQSGVRHATVDGTAGGEETTLARKLREDGVVDLRSTVDTDGDITWAPAVIHEVIKPHQHEIVQHKIYREIHNYEHFHRIQPVMMTEVLPPRHWIPNPNGEGLIEISADELPARTGENRWWSICEHSSPYSLQNTTLKYRTEPEIIEAGTFMTEEGFERKETIIIHPPTLADLTGYGGPVQAVHFDHKTGKRWMGELTTMDQLHKLQQELDRAPDAHAVQMDGLAESLSRVTTNSTRRGSKSLPLRKPVSGQSSVTHGPNVGRKINAA